MLTNKEQLLFSSIRSRQCYNPSLINYKINRINDIDIQKYSNKLKFSKFIKDISSINYNKPIILKNNVGFLLNDKNNLYINFQGSKNYLELLDSVNSKSISPFDFSDSEIHSGFGTLFLDIKDELTEEIINIIKSYNIKRITFTGHSKGGSMASIASLYYGHKLNYNDKNFFISNHTFGMPVTGDQKFINDLLNYCDISFNVQNDNDIVQYIPLNKNFKHVPLVIKIYEDTFRIDNETKTLNLTDLLLFGVKQRYDLIKNHSCEQYIENIINKLL